MVQDFFHQAGELPGKKEPLERISHTKPPFRGDVTDIRNHIVLHPFIPTLGFHTLDLIFFLQILQRVGKVENATNCRWSKRWNTVHPKNQTNNGKFRTTGYFLDFWGFYDVLQLNVIHAIQSCPQDSENIGNVFCQQMLQRWHFGEDFAAGTVLKLLQNNVMVWGHVSVRMKCDMVPWTSNWNTCAPCCAKSSKMTQAHACKHNTQGGQALQSAKVPSMIAIQTMETRLD